MSEKPVEWWEHLLNGGLALCNNYIYTGQTERAAELLSQLEKTIPDHPMVRKLRSIDTSIPDLELIQFFGRHWKGEDLQGKSIEVFCDQGMGDIINMLRYLDEMKRKWPSSQIVLNCYAYYEKFSRLMEMITYVDRFTDHHIPCDYHSNIFSVPIIMSGYTLDVPYPAHFHLLLEAGIPKKTLRISRKLRVGIAWQSNALNGQLAARKSMDLQDVLTLVDNRWELISLLPEKIGVAFLNESYVLNDLYDTASLISTLDVVVSVDTVVLHLAGIMSKKSIGLLCTVADPRWGEIGDTQPWYSPGRLYRQKTLGDWSHPLHLVRDELEHLYNMMERESNG